MARRSAPTTITFDQIKGVPPPELKPYTPHGSAREVWSIRADECLVEGPSGTGKSRAILERINYMAGKYAESRYLVCRKTRTSMTQSTLVTWEKHVRPDLCRAVFHHESQEYRYPNGSLVVIAGLDDEEKIKSTDFDLVYANEATELAESEAEMLTTRLRNYVVPYQMLIMDCNPDAPDHWLNQRCIRGVTRRIQSRHEDNPRLYDHEKGEWTEEGRQYIARLDNLTGYRKERLRYGRWAGAEGMYFPEWDEALHICDAFEIPTEWPRWTATDYGFAANFCTLWAAINPDDRHHIYIYREAYGTGLRDEQQAEMIRTLSVGENIRRYIGDPSMWNERKEQRRPSIAAVYRSHGVPLMPGDNRRIAGWQCVRRALAADHGVLDADGNPRRPRLQILRGRAPNLVRTLPIMVHDPLNSEDLADKIRQTSTEDHACLVGETHVQMANGYKRIDQVRVGDIVQTRMGPKAVTDWAMTADSAPVYIVTLSNGRILTGTGNHPVWVLGKGWVMLDTLRYGDVIWGQEGICEAKQSSSMVSSSDVILIAPVVRIACIIRRLATYVRRGLGLFTKRFGSLFTGRFHLAIILTTLIEILSTILQRICVQSWLAYIYQSMGQNASVPNPCENTWPLSDHWPLNGMALVMGWSGIESMGRMYLGILPRETTLVNGVGQHLRRASTAGSGSAPITAKLHGGEGRRRMTRIASVLSVVRRFVQTSMPIQKHALVSVVHVSDGSDEAPVYNITVESAHEYFAQGVLVANCDSLRYLLQYEATPHIVNMPTQRPFVVSGTA